jgi:Asp/Glu/hydantoin racemase
VIQQPLTVICSKNIDVMETENDFDNVHHLPYEDNDVDDNNVDDDSDVVNIGCSTLTRYQEKMRAAVVEFLSIAEGCISVESSSKLMDNVLSTLRAATVQLRAENHTKRIHRQINAS